ncbi:hypothetical protein ACFL1X_14170, partial [Candidatus Hydrogenedentota bacterium]
QGNTPEKSLQKGLKLVPFGTVTYFWICNLLAHHNLQLPTPSPSRALCYPIVIRVLERHVGTAMDHPSQRAFAFGKPH